LSTVGESKATNENKSVRESSLVDRAIADNDRPTASRGDNADETLMDKALRLLNLQKNISDYSSAY
jgi:hypothetical protein